MHPLKKNRAIPLALLVALSSGCASQQPAQPSESDKIAIDYPDDEQMAIRQPRVTVPGLNQSTNDVGPDVYQDRDAERVEVVRGGRYALVTANASLQQRDLLEQVVNISIPDSMNPTVEDGLRYLLQHTGYGLCMPQNKPQQILYSRPLPTAHFRMGPMPLREALQVIAGSAFDVQADPLLRTICYQVRGVQIPNLLGGRP